MNRALARQAIQKMLELQDEIHSLRSARRPYSSSDWDDIETKVQHRDELRDSLVAMIPETP